MLRSTILLLRFPFSLFLMPVYWFALSSSLQFNNPKAILIFIILHLLIYPASNGYNSYMDRDEESIGGLKKPPSPTKQLFYTTLLLDSLGIILSAFIGLYFMTGIVLYILASRAYSYRGIRLKKYPIAGYLTVILFQGGLIYSIVSQGVADSSTYDIDVIGMIAASLLIGSFYPLTQIYQHNQDKKDGVTTISYMLGYTGTFIFSAIIFTAALLMFGWKLNQQGLTNQFLIFTMFFIPVLIYFIWWFLKVNRDIKNADFNHTMKMNIIASLCTNAAFLYLFILQH